MKTVALALSFLLAFPALGEDTPAPVHVYVAPVPAPPVYASMEWVYAQGTTTTSTPGFWFTEAQIVRTDARLQYLEKKAAQECFDRTVEADKKLLFSSKALWISGALGVILGVGLGVYIHQRIVK